MIADQKSTKEDSIDAGEGNDSANVKLLLNPESRDRRRRDAPTDNVEKKAADSENEPQYPDAQGVSDKYSQAFVFFCYRRLALNEIGLGTTTFDFQCKYFLFDALKWFFIRFL